MARTGVVCGSLANPSVWSGRRADTLGDFGFLKMPEGRNCSYPVRAATSVLRWMRYGTAWGLTPQIVAEVDDMAMLLLLARDGAWVAAVPAVVVKDELRGGKLAVYCDLPDIFENFYAITLRRRRRSSLISDLLQNASVTMSNVL